MERRDMAPGRVSGTNRFGTTWAVWLPQLISLLSFGAAVFIAVDVVTHLSTSPTWAMPAGTALIALGGFSLSAALFACVATRDRATFLVGKRRQTDEQIIRMAVRQMIGSTLPLILVIALVVYDLLKAQTSAS